MNLPPDEDLDVHVVSLGTQDIPAILALENVCWLPAIRADEQTLRKRFGLGHIMLGLLAGDALLGIVSFSYTLSSPEKAIGLPQTFREFSNRTMAPEYNTAFAYNLNIHPRARRGNLTMKLIQAGLSRMRKDGCRYVLGAGRCPSYNGSLAGGIEIIPPAPDFRRSIDQCVQTGMLPAPEELLVDPILRFYRRALDCEFLRVIPGFLPGDSASGGFGVIFYKMLDPVV